MIKITNVTARNFLSVGNATQAVRLDAHGLTLVLGKYVDGNEGMDRNGVGKSSILQAICYGLYGKPLTKIKMPNLVNNVNNKAMSVTLEFERDGVTYRIERGQKPTFLKFFVNDKEISKEEKDEAQGENKNTQEEIDRLVGMSHTMFRHIVALNTFTDPFLKLTVAEQRSIIEELLGVAQISHRAETLKRLISETKDSIRDEEAMLRALTEANNRILHTIKQAENNSANWVANSEAKKQELLESIAAMDQIDFDAEIAVFDAIEEFRKKEQELSVGIAAENREVMRLQREIKAVEDEALRYDADSIRMNAGRQIARLTEEVARKYRDEDRHRAAAKKLLTQKEGLEAALAHADAENCTTCGQALAGTDHLATVVHNLKTKIDELAVAIAREEAEAAARLAETLPIQQEKEAVESAAADQVAEADKKAVECLRMADDLRQELGAHQERVKAATEALKALGTCPTAIFDTRDEVYKTKQMYDFLVRDLSEEEKRENPYLGQIADLKDTLQTVDTAQLDEHTALLKHQEFVLKLLTSKDSFIRKKIIEQNLNYLNSRMNFYLEKLGLPHEVCFLSDLSVEITKLGREFDYEQLSRGEMNRVNMATSWSFRDVWESLNHSMNLMFVDEMIDSGMDNSGAEVALDVLKKMSRDRGKNIFLISHKDNLTSRVNQILMVYKENEFTRFELGAEP